MEKTFSHALAVLRIGLGWIFFSAGLSKIIDPAWSAAGYLTHALSLPQFFAWFALPGNIGWVNFLNEWGLLLIGLSLIAGLFVRYSSYIGILLLILYWLPIFHFPFSGSVILVDDHIVYILVLVVFITSNAGQYFGLDSLYFNKKA